PLNGSRILGSFEDKNDYLVLNFDTIVIKGISYSINAVALDPATTRKGMRTDIDHHYLERAFLPMAAKFVEGLSQAVSDSGLTSVTVEGGAAVSSEGEKSDKQQVASGIEEAGKKLGEILDDQADDVEVTVKIASGTPIGILFLDPVTKQQGDNAVVTG